MADELATMLLKRLGSLQTQRETWASHWQELADYVVPLKADVTKHRSPGDKRTELIFDGTAIHAAELLSASLHGMLTNASTSWFGLRFKDRVLNGDDEAREWLQGVEDVMYQAFNRSNFQEQIHELYHDLITFGTAVMFVDADDEQQIRFSTRHIAECYLSEDQKGRVDTVYRKFKMPGRAVIARFVSDQLNSKIQQRIKENPYELIELVHAVYQRDEYDTTKIDSQNKPVASVYMEPSEKIVLSESGFDEFPYMAPRLLKASFEIGYGTVPGGLNFYRSGTRDRLEPLNIGANNPLGLNMEEQRRQAIRAAFYVDQLILGQGPQMTATEVVQRTEEKMRLLGPVLGRLQAELLQPLIDRVYNLLARQKAFEVAPEILADQAIDIEYVSPLAKAQRQGDIQAMTRLLELMMPLTQLDPGIMDYIDADGISKHLIKILAVPATAVRGDREVALKRQERQEQQQQAAEAQEDMQAAQAAGQAAPMIQALK